MDYHSTSYDVPSPSSKAVAMAAADDVDIVFTVLTTVALPPSSSVIHHIDDDEPTPDPSRAQAIEDINSPQRRLHLLPRWPKSSSSSPIGTHFRSRQKHHQGSIFMAKSNGADPSTDGSGSIPGHLFRRHHPTVDSSPKSAASPPLIPFAITASSSGRNTPFLQWTTSGQHLPHLKMPVKSSPLLKSSSSSPTTPTAHDIFPLSIPKAMVGDQHSPRSDNKPSSTDDKGRLNIDRHAM
ncbi:hypothetical protein ACLOJK_039203 [Asimina triloba]